MNNLYVLQHFNTIILWSRFTQAALRHDLQQSTHFLIVFIQKLQERILTRHTKFFSVATFDPDYSSEANQGFFWDNETELF